MFNYVNSVRVLELRNCRNNKKTTGETLDEQLQAVFAHIEDLEEVNQKVKRDDLAQYYSNAAASDKSS